MLTIVLFILGLIFLLTRKYASLLTVIMILSTTFLQLQIKDGPLFTIPGFNTHDFGILLYLLFFINIAIRYGCKFSGKIQRAVTLFLVFLLLNGIFDIFYYGTSVTDVIKYLKNWIMLTIVYIYPYIKTDYVIKSLKHIYTITLIMSIFITICMVLRLDLGILWFSEERGIKPPPDCMWFTTLAFFNLWGKNKTRSILESFIFIIPVVLSLKMTYAVTIVLVLGFFIIMNKTTTTSTKTALAILMFIGVTAVLYTSASFSERLTNLVAETEDISQEENSGNFSYRILHAQERWEYIKKDPIMLTRGFGYLHEKNLKRQIFMLGVYQNGQQQQLDTGDIVWSLFFIRLGLLGIFFYIYMYISIFKQYYKKRDRKICLLFASMMISYLFFTSLGNCIISYSYFFVYPILFLNLTNNNYRTAILNHQSA